MRTTASARNDGSLASLLGEHRRKRMTKTEQQRSLIHPSFRKDVVLKKQAESRVVVPISDPVGRAVDRPIFAADKHEAVVLTE